MIGFAVLIMFDLASISTQQVCGVCLIRTGLLMWFDKLVAVQCILSQYSRVVYHFH